jgi:hypothetical protein
VEMSIEAKHAIAKNKLQGKKMTSPPLFSLSLRMAELKGYLDFYPEMLKDFVQCFHQFRDIYTLIGKMGMQSLQSLLDNDTRLHKSVRLAFYHCDLYSQYKQNKATNKKILSDRKSRAIARQPAPVASPCADPLQHMLGKAMVQHIQTVCKQECFYSMVMGGDCKMDSFTSRVGCNGSMGAAHGDLKPKAETLNLFGSILEGSCLLNGTADMMLDASFKMVDRASGFFFRVVHTKPCLQKRPRPMDVANELDSFELAITLHKFHRAHMEDKTAEVMLDPLTQQGVEKSAVCLWMPPKNLPIAALRPALLEWSVERVECVVSSVKDVDENMVQHIVNDMIRAQAFPADYDIVGTLGFYVVNKVEAQLHHRALGSMAEVRVRAMCCSTGPNPWAQWLSLWC